MISRTIALFIWTQRHRPIPVLGRLHNRCRTVLIILAHTFARGHAASQAPETYLHPERRRQRSGCPTRPARCLENKPSLALLGGVKICSYGQLAERPGNGHTNRFVENVSDGGELIVEGVTGTPVALQHNILMVDTIKATC